MRIPNYFCKKWHRKEFWLYQGADQGDLVYFCKKCQAIKYVKDDRKGFWNKSERS